MEAAYLIDFYLAYEFEMELHSIQHNSYFANEVNNTIIVLHWLCIGYV